METRAITEDEVELFFREILRTFGDDPQAADSWASRLVQLLSLSRTYAVFEHGEIVGTSAAFEFELTVPGNTLPMAGLTMVTVRPTHRRRGILRSMMAAYLDDLHAHGEPLGGLWASEASIYGRFGFGVAAESDKVEVDTRGMSVRWPAPLDQVRFVEDDGAMEHLPGIYETVRRDRPGMLSRSDAWWRTRRLHDPSSRRNGASAKRRCVSFRAGVATGYVVFRQRMKWDGELAAGSVEITELVGVDSVATASLWHFATNVDLFPRVKWWNAPIDSALPWMTEHVRNLQRRRTDTLWLRVCDVPAALSGRAYEANGRLRLAVCNPGESGTAVFELAVEDGEGTCVEAAGTPDIVLDRCTLASLYLGGASASTLARAGLIEGSSPAVALATRMFRWNRAPWCPEVF